jgi:hypothetical protein
MTADVYAGDEALSGSTAGAPRIACRFTVVADHAPDTLLRVAGQLLLSNTLPARVCMQDNGDRTVTIQAELRGVGAALADSIRRKLEQLTVVWRVEWAAIATDD